MFFPFCVASVTEPIGQKLNYSYRVTLTQSWECFWLSVWKCSGLNWCQTYQLHQLQSKNPFTLNLLIYFCLVIVLSLFLLDMVQDSVVQILAYWSRLRRRSCNSTASGITSMRMFTHSSYNSVAATITNKMKSRLQQWGSYLTNTIKILYFYGRSFF